MCGIAGYLGPRRMDRRRLDECLNRMRHRGPDAAHLYEHLRRDGCRVHLLHTRLRILDLDPRSDQPFRVGSQVLAFNGELYNYRELNTRRGWSGRTRGDTEVLGAVLAADGVAGLDACEGMWAFARYDERDGSLTLGRDRFGEKPLYVYEADGGVYFGSEVKFIRALTGRPLEVDRDHLCRYLVNGYKALYKNGSAFFSGLTEIQPGTVRVYRDSAATDTAYWRPHTADETDDRPYAEIVADVRERVIRAVDLRLRSDVPVAFMLSGGVDSNTLAAVARRELGRDVHGFTVVNDDGRYDERAVVDEVVDDLGLEHTTVRLDTADFLPRLRELVRAHDAPVYTITYYAHWLLMQQVAGHGYRVSISGTGADELFSGYYDHHNAYLYEVRDDPHRYAEALGDWQRWIRPIVRNPHLADPDLFIRAPAFRDHVFLDREVFAGMLHRPFHEPFAEAAYCAGLLRNRMLNELFHEAVPPILHEDDHNAMSVSVENRSPFLDRGLFETSRRIPTRHLVGGGYAKKVLRDAMRGIVPDRVLDERRKVGFNAPIDTLLDRRDPATRRAILADSPVWDLVRRDAVERLLDASELPNSRSKFLFNVVNAGMFLEEFAA